MKKEYSAGFTSEGWFQNELTVVLQYKLDGLTQKEILDEVISNNLFQLSSESSMKKRFQMVYRRTKMLTNELAHFYISGSRLDQKAIILYSYLKVYRFPYEFFMEVILSNFRQDKRQIEAVDLDFFMERKEGESEKVTNWRPETKKRLRSSILLFLRESGIIQKISKDAYEIIPLHISSKLKKYARDNDKLLQLLSEMK